jgi:hypothetical protein
VINEGKVVDKEEKEYKGRGGLERREVFLVK